MKVVFISMFRSGYGGGEGRVAHELAHHFAKKHDTVLICPAERTGLYQEDSLKIYGVQSAGVDEFHMPVLTAKTVNHIFDFLDSFNPDVVHSHEPALMGLIGQIWAKLEEVPFVHTTHVLPDKILNFGASDALNLALLRNSLSASVTRRVLTDFYENCDAIVALNEPARKSLRQYGYKGKIFIIPNGRDLQLYRQSQNADITSREKILTFTGYISERKNQAYLLEMLRHLPEAYRLVLVGKPINPEDGERLKTYCHHHDIDERVTFAGQVSHEQIPDYLEQAHLFVSASKMEVQSLSIIEALASGTPLVGLSNETIAELVDENVGVCLPADTPPETFAQHVIEICSLPPDAYERLCQQAQERVSHLDWSNVIDRTVVAYQALMEEENDSTETSPRAKRAFDDLISLLTTGDVRKILKSRQSKLFTVPAPTFLERLAIGKKLKRLQRVSRSTWLFAAITVVVSIIGYVVMRIKNMRQSLQ